MTRSIRRQVALASLATTVGLLVALALAVVIGVRIVLVRQLDRQLRDEVRIVASLAGFDREKGLELDLGGLEPQKDGGALLEVWSGADVLFRSEALRGVSVPRRLASGPEPAFAWTTGTDGGRLRCVGLTFRPAVEVEEDEAPLPAAAGPGDSPEVQLVLAKSDEAVTEVLRGLFLLLGVCGLGFVAGAVVLSRNVARTGLRPLREFAHRISELDDRSLSKRLDLAAAPEEVRPVGERLNELLDRLDATLERERALSADVAHELRTPLAGLRSTVEVALRGSGDPGAVREAFADALAGVKRLQSLVDRLLWLVRLDAGTVDTEVRPFEVDALLREMWEPLERDAEARGLRLTWEAAADARALSDPLLVGIAVRNLLENAVAYADDGGTVRVRVRSDAESIVVEISNSGSTVRQRDVAGLLRRFTRGDAARTPVGSRCGLGLPLVENVARVLGHSVSIRTDPGREFEVALHLTAA